MKTKPTQKNIPEGWEEKRLSEVAVFLDRKRIPIESDERSNRKGVYPYYGASGIIDYIDGYIFDGEYILLGEDGANIIDRSTPLAFIAKGKFWVNNHAHILQPKERTNIHFLSEYLESLDYSKYNTGSAQPKLNGTICQAIPVLLPTLSEQNRIVKVLETWDKAIEVLTNKIDLKKNIKKGLMQNLLSGKIRLSGFKNEWQTLKFNQVVSQVVDFRGKTPMKLGMSWGGTIPALSANNVKKGYIDFDSECHLASEELYSTWMNKGDLKKGDIVFTMEAPLGNVALIPDNRKYLLSQRVVSFRLFETMDNEFIYHHLMSEIFQDKLTLLATGSTAKGINQKSLSRVTFNIPSLAEQSSIARVFETCDEEIRALEKKLTLLKEQKKFLLNNLITGAIRTPESIK